VSFGIHRPVAPAYWAKLRAAGDLFNGRNDERFYEALHRCRQRADDSDWLK
jgi:hypothetical protein